MAQTTGYGFTSTVAQAGQKVDMMFDTVGSYAAEGVVPFGVGLIQGTADDQAKVADSAAGAFLGVSLFTHAKEQSLAGVAEYADTDAISVLEEGRVWMETVGAFTKNAPVYIIVAAGATQGQATATATANLGPVGKFKTSGTGALAQVELDTIGA